MARVRLGWRKNKGRILDRANKDGSDSVRITVGWLHPGVVTGTFAVDMRTATVANSDRERPGKHLGLPKTAKEGRGDHKVHTLGGQCRAIKNSSKQRQLSAVYP